MNKTLLYAMGLIFMIALTTSGCKKCDDPTDPECPNYCVDETDPACPNYDPCWDQTEVSAEFRIIENGSYSSITLVDTVYFDTVYARNLVTEPIQEHADWTYTWKIGAETYTEKTTSLDYSTAPQLQKIPITLIVEGPPNSSCFANDDGRDTITRFVVLDRRYPDTLVYAGYRDGDVTDSLTISVYMDYVRGRRRFAGLTDSCDTEIDIAARTWRKFEAKDASIGCNAGVINLTCDPEKKGDFDRVSGQYSYLEDNNESEGRLYFRFDGRQIR